MQAASIDGEPWSDGGCPHSSIRALVANEFDSTSSTPVCGVGIINGNIQLRCPSVNQVIAKVVFANYGNPDFHSGKDSSTCNPTTDMKIGDCHLDATDYIKKGCLGKNSCDLSITTELIKDGDTPSGACQSLDGAFDLFVQVECFSNLKTN